MRANEERKKTMLEIWIILLCVGTIIVGCTAAAIACVLMISKQPNSKNSGLDAATNLPAASGPTKHASTTAHQTKKYFSWSHVCNVRFPSESQQCILQSVAVTQHGDRGVCLLRMTKDSHPYISIFTWEVHDTSPTFIVSLQADDHALFCDLSPDGSVVACTGSTGDIVLHDAMPLRPPTLKTYEILGVVPTSDYTYEIRFDKTAPRCMFRLSSASVDPKPAIYDLTYYNGTTWSTIGTRVACFDQAGDHLAFVVPDETSNRRTKLYTTTRPAGGAWPTTGWTLLDGTKHSKHSMSFDRVHVSGDGDGIVTHGGEWAMQTSYVKNAEGVWAENDYRSIATYKRDNMYGMNMCVHGDNSLVSSTTQNIINTYYARNIVTRQPMEAYGPNYGIKCSRILDQPYVLLYSQNMVIGEGAAISIFKYGA